MSVPSQQSAKAINLLGQDILVTLNPATVSTGIFAQSTTTWNSSGTIIPSIKGMKYFRAIATTICEIYCSFAKNAYVLTSDGNLGQSKNILAGYDDIWYETDNSDINTMEIILIAPLVSTDSISIIFQFVEKVPSELLFE